MVLVISTIIIKTALYWYKEYRSVEQNGDYRNRSINVYRTFYIIKSGISNHRKYGISVIRIIANTKREKNLHTEI